MTIWQLAQTFWVGGLLSMHFVFLPVLERMGLAPLLVEEVNNLISPLIIGCTAVLVLVQGFVLIQSQGARSLWRDLRGQLLLMVLVVVAVYFGVRQWFPEAEFWLRYSYLVMVFCGLLLVVQPLPGQRRAESVA